MNTLFTKTAKPIVLYRHPLSGHCHKVELMLSLLGLPFRTVDVDLANGAHKAVDFLSLNAFGQVPVLDDNGIVLSDSNAIIVYLASRYQEADHEWLPSDPARLALAQRWLSVAAGEIARGPAAARLVTVFGAPIDHDDAINRAAQILSLMEHHLTANEFLANNQLSVADIACYSYVAHAPEGAVTLDQYPNVRAWLMRIESLEAFVAMQATPLVKQAS